MSHRVLHLLSQRPSWTGSGVALNALVRAASLARWEQAAVVGTPGDEPSPEVGDLDAARIFPLVFDQGSLDFPLPGMSDVMPYRSTRFSAMSGDQVDRYCTTWRDHVGRVIDEFQPDVIHSHHVWLLSSLVKDVAPTTPVVTHCHGTGLRQLELCPQLADQVCRGCHRNDAFVVLHDGHAQQLHERLGVTRDQIRIVGSGFRPDIFYDELEAYQGPVIAYAGKLSNAKGVPWLLDAFEQAAREIPHLELHIAGSGSGEEADAIRARIEPLDNVTLHGQLDQQSLANLLRRAAVFVLPSFYEGLPLVLVEAAACGCRLVTTSLPGVTNQLAPELGGALDIIPLPRLEAVDRPVEEDLPAFVDNLASAIVRAHEQAPLLAAGSLVQRLTWDAVFSRIQAIWYEVAQFDPHASLPSSADINPIPEDLDGQCAEEHFLGKSLDEATDLFFDNFLYYQEDLLFMGAAAFCFYLPAAIRYAESPEAVLDGDVTRCLVDILSLRWEQDRAGIVASRDVMLRYSRDALTRVPQMNVRPYELTLKLERLIDKLTAAD